MKEITLTQGKVALVDDEDYEWLNNFKWHANISRDTFYAVKWDIVDEKRILLGMHRLIMNTPRNLEVDHIDHNGLNNQKYNLRNVTHRENMNNKIVRRVSSKKQSNTISGYHGVLYVRQGGYEYIIARIKVGGRQIVLGHFKTIEDAALAYNKAALKYFGVLAMQNIIKKAC